MNPLIDEDFGPTPLRRSEAVYEPPWEPESLPVPAPVLRYLGFAVVLCLLAAAYGVFK